jgi:hypothetical protein
MALPVIVVENDGNPCSFLGYVPTDEKAVFKRKITPFPIAQMKSNTITTKTAWATQEGLDG